MGIFVGNMTASTLPVLSTKYFSLPVVLVDSEFCPEVENRRQDDVGLDRTTAALFPKGHDVVRSTPDRA